MQREGQGDGRGLVPRQQEDQHLVADLRVAQPLPVISSVEEQPEEVLLSDGPRSGVGR